MKRGQIWLFALLTVSTLQSCNTLYNTTAINLEIVEPAQVIFPGDIKKIALKYNNSNVSYNPWFARYSTSGKIKVDEFNNDSIASFVYFNSFKNQIKNSLLFDTIIEVTPVDYSGVKFETSGLCTLDSAIQTENVTTREAADILKQLHSKFTTPPENPKQEIKLNRALGMYTKNDLREIKESTGADLLLSLDYFSVYEEMNYMAEALRYAHVYVLSMWNFYNLNEDKLQYYYNRVDTISWHRSYNENIKLPNRNDAMMNAAQISGEKFSNYLAPHWIPVQRMLYQSGQSDLKKAEQLAEENRWLEAAQLWRKNIDNKNKSIAAKSMYNLAVASEIMGEIDAAMDWVVKSYQVFEQKNEVHEFHCKDYINILGQRRFDFKKIDLQLKPQLRQQ